MYTCNPFEAKTTTNVSNVSVPPTQHLRIQDVKPRDAGDYICRAENSLVRAEATTTLEVLLAYPNTFR